MPEFNYEPLDRRCFESVWTHCDLGAVDTMSLFHYSDGMILEEWTYWDQLGLREQLKP